MICGLVIPVELIGVGVASSISSAGTVQMLLAFVLILTVVQWQLRRKWVFYEN